MPLYSHKIMTHRYLSCFVRNITMLFVINHDYGLYQARKRTFWHQINGILTVYNYNGISRIPTIHHSVIIHNHEHVSRSLKTTYHTIINHYSILPLHISHGFLETGRISPQAKRAFFGALAEMQRCFTGERAAEG